MGQKNSSTNNGRHKQEEKYERILEAALQIFAAKGFHEARISEIARAAGVADGTIYLYFKNKDDILLSLFEAKLEIIIDGLRAEIAKGSTAREQLERAIRYHFRQALRNPAVTQFITVEIRRSSTFMKEYGKERFVEYLQLFEGVLRRGKETGELGPWVKTGMLTQILFGALDFACVTWVSNPNREPEDLDAVGEFLIDLLGRALHP